ncbi:MAG TPA: hypothetical protein VGM23_07455, partial [Armatimonadota bacterium]
NKQGDLTKVISLVDCRHNAGAVMAFVDGHVQWLAAGDATLAVGFLDSIDPATPQMVPIGLGPLSATNLRVSPYDVNDTAIYKLLANFGTTIAVCGGGTSAAANYKVKCIAPSGESSSYARDASSHLDAGLANFAPTWMQVGPTGSTLTLPATISGDYPVTWLGGTSFTNSAYGLTYNNGTAVLTIVPKVTAPTAKKVAMVMFNIDNKTQTGAINAVQVGGATFKPTLASIAVNKQPTGWSGNACGFLIPVLPNTPVQISATCTGLTSIFFAFEP